MECAFISSDEYWTVAYSLLALVAGLRVILVERTWAVGKCLECGSAVGKKGFWETWVVDK
jgi:hypothetical protein